MPVCCGPAVGDLSRWLQGAWGRLQAHRASPHGQRLISATLWAAVAEGCSRGFLLVALVIVARLLGTTVYGEFGVIRSTTNMFAVVGGMGLGLAANRFVAEHRECDPHYTGGVVGSTYLLAGMAGLLVAGLLLLAADWLATAYLRAPHLVPSLRIAAMLLVVGAVNGAQLGVLQGLEAYRQLAAVSLVQGGLAVLALVGGAWRFGLTGAVGGLVLYGFGGILVYQVSIRRELARRGISVDVRQLQATIPLFWKFSLPLVLAGVAIAPLKWAAEGMLARQGGFAGLGLLYAAMVVVTTLFAVVSTLNAPLISLMANLRPDEQSARKQHLTLFGSWYLFLGLGLPLVLVPESLAWLFGPAYASKQFYLVTVLLLVYCGLMLFGQGVTRMIALSGSMWFGFYSNLTEGVSLVGGFYLLLGYGVVGLALAYVGSYVIRLAVIVPMLGRSGVLPRGMLLDRGFLASVGLFLAAAGLQVVRYA